MLQQALGGNSSTIMVCAIRPGHTYYDETLNTLKYADRAKKIKNKPTINESPQDKIIRELQEENKRLKEQMGSGGGGGGGGMDDAELKKKMEEMERNERQLEEMKQSWEAKLAAKGDRDEEDEKRKAEEAEARASGRPQLLNLNEDGMLDRKIFFDLSKKTDLKVGRKGHGDGAEDPDVVLGGVGIQEKHAEFDTTPEGTFIKPLSKESMPFVFINGKPMTDMKPRKLKPNDRIIFGTGSCFLFRNEDNKDQAEIQDTPDKPITYELAMKEKLDEEDKIEAQKREKEKAEQEAETAKKMQELQDKMNKEREEMEKAQAARIAEMEAKMKAMQVDLGAAQDDEKAHKEAKDRELDMMRQIEEEKLKAQKDE